MAILATSVTFSASTPKRTLSNLSGAAAGIIRLWLRTPIPLRIGDDATLTLTNGLPVDSLEENFYEFAAANTAGTSVSLIRDAGPDVVIHMMTEV